MGGGMDGWKAAGWNGEILLHKAVGPLDSYLESSIPPSIRSSNPPPCRRRTGGGGIGEASFALPWGA